jgi:hypothetical protein
MPDHTNLAIQNNGIVAQALDGMSRPLARQTTREIEHVVRRTAVANVHEEGRAQLCQTALMNAGILAMLEENLIQMAPLGSEAYQAINQAHAIGACKKIMQW